jgi:mono/diheme cytochrome c family protein
MKFTLHKSTLVSISVLLFVGLTAMDIRSINKEEIKFGPDTPLQTVLNLLGDKKPVHYLENIDPVQVEKGKQIVFTGQTTGPNGKKSNVVSRFFTCVHCHNTVIEDPDLRKSNPETRMDFVIAQNKPLLPATTFYGIVNRTTYYNDDYAKKYGKLVDPARDTLVNAMQLCATECSQGRKMEKWEIDAVMAYYYSIQYKLSDLKLSESEYAQLNEMITGNTGNNSQGLAMLKAKYLQASPATFVNYSDKAIRKYGEQGNPENGKKIYIHSCMNCHKTVGGVTNFKLDMEKVTFRNLKRNFNKNNHFSAYYMVRKGTYAVPGYRPYMPNFSEERLSHQQMEDLVAFINQQAK